MNEEVTSGYTADDLESLYSSEEVIDKRYRNWMLLLYPDSTSYNYNEVLQDLKGSFKNYAYIIHKPESTEKKQHVHFILILDNPRSIQSLANRLNIPINHIRNLKSIRGSCRYLTHIDNEDKIRYSLSDVVYSNSFRNDFLKCYDDLMSEDDIIKNIFSFIDSAIDLSYSDFLSNLVIYINSNNFQLVYKRYRQEFLNYYNSLHP